MRFDSVLICTHNPCSYHSKENIRETSVRREQKNRGKKNRKQWSRKIENRILKNIAQKSLIEQIISKSDRLFAKIIEWHGQWQIIFQSKINNVNSTEIKYLQWPIYYDINHHKYFMTEIPNIKSVVAVTHLSFTT